MIPGINRDSCDVVLYTWTVLDQLELLRIDLLLELLLSLSFEGLLAIANQFIFELPKMTTSVSHHTGDDEAAVLGGLAAARQLRRVERHLVRQRRHRIGIFLQRRYRKGLTKVRASFPVVTTTNRRKLQYTLGRTLRAWRRRIEKAMQLRSGDLRT